MPREACRGTPSHLCGGSTQILEAEHRPDAGFTLLDVVGHLCKIPRGRFVTLDQIVARVMQDHQRPCRLSGADVVQLRTANIGQTVHVINP